MSISKTAINEPQISNEHNSQSNILGVSKNKLSKSVSDTNLNASKHPKLLTKNSTSSNSLKSIDETETKNGCAIM